MTKTIEQLKDEIRLADAETRKLFGQLDAVDEKFQRMEDEKARLEEALRYDALEESDDIVEKMILRKLVLDAKLKFWPAEVRKINNAIDSIACRIGHFNRQISEIEQLSHDENLRKKVRELISGGSSA